MTGDFIQHEQNYQFPLGAEDIYIEVTFYKEYKYRVLVCDTQGESVSWELLDANRNVLFSNTFFDYSEYWDFTFENTIECFIRVSRKAGTALSDIHFYLGYKDILNK